MAIVFNGGNITLSGTVEGVDFSALRGKVISHSHPLSGEVGAFAETLDCTDTDGGAQFYTAENVWGGNAAYRAAYAVDASNSIERTHRHEHALSVSGTTATTSMSASRRTYVTIEANGKVTLNRIDGYAPEVIYDRYDGHYHSVTGTIDSETLPSRTCKGYASGTFYPYFRIADDSGGTNARWENGIYIRSGAHGHTRNTIALAPYDAPDPPFGGATKFVADGPSGNITEAGQINGIDIGDFGDDYSAHTHDGDGQTSTDGPWWSGMRDSGGTMVFFLVGFGTWKQGRVKGEAHSHSGLGVTVGAPS